MSRLLVDEYFNEVERLKRVAGTTTENVVSEAFKDLLKGWSRQKNLVFAAQYEFLSPQKTRIRPDGTILHALRVPFGYWEAKDEADDLDDEIAKKLRRGYPQDNIVFEDSREAVLIQNRQPIMRCRMDDGGELVRLLDRFFGYERAEITEFREAVEQFKRDLPAVLEALRDMIDAAYSSNEGFRTAADAFLQHAKETINPTLGEADVREMLIQHVLTEDIFSQVFDDPEFHRNNNIARELYRLESKFFTGPAKRETLAGLRPYYSTIRSRAAVIGQHSEKQAFLKVIYENFYKVYDPKKADRLGVIYTPSEIVKFMVEGADWLTQKHFGKALIDEGVEILDPATGTGTFVCELLEHFRGQPKKLARKYLNELHANEVAILPYYVANLNIEATYAEITGEYVEFPNLCFVDTLDNVGGLGIRRGHQHDLFAGLSDENVERVKRQNRRTISVIIGNPPYNANQQNENDNNKNRTYPHIDGRIKATYIAQSTAQKTKLYDMYARFFRWASDRLGDEGVLCFITNRSFIDARTFDGFRKSVIGEFSDVYVVDLGGDWKRSDDAGGGNVFGIGTGVAVTIAVRRRSSKSAKIHYLGRPRAETADEKLSFLANRSMSSLRFENVAPDKAGGWIGQTQNQWAMLMPLVDRATKTTQRPSAKAALFSKYYLGVSTNRDEWVYDVSELPLLEKARYLARGIAASDDDPDARIKWSRNLKRRRRQGLVETIGVVRPALYRPFVRKSLFDSSLFVDERGVASQFTAAANNVCLGFTDSTGQKPWMVLAASLLPDLHLVGSGAGTVCAMRRYVDTSGEVVDNITDWGLNQFVRAYGRNGVLDPARAEGSDGETIGKRGTRARQLGKDDIIHYVYAVLHDPVYRETYALNLRREFPRIPFYRDFWTWVDWGSALMALHVGYEAVEPWELERIDTPDEKARAAGLGPKAMLKADKAEGIVRLDRETRLAGFPAAVWDYRLGNRSAVEWVLDQYKEKTPKDPTIREKFNTYRFADYKEKIIDLLGRVTRVSVETVAITEKMRVARR